MAILVDRPRWPRHDTRFAHLVSDDSLAELHAFVHDLAPERPLRFHRDHYDVPEHLWPDAVRAGARVVSARDIVRALRTAGLRRA